MKNKLFLSLLFFTSLIAPATQGVDVTLLNGKLEYQKTDINKIDQKYIYLDKVADEKISTNTIYRIIINDDSAKKKNMSTDSYFYLDDGQIIQGRVVSSTEDGETIIINNSSFGDFEIKLENISKIITHRKIKNLKQSGDDQIQLSNGQVLSGFISKIGKNTIEIQVGDSVVVNKIPSTNVASIVLANPVTNKKDKHHLVIFTDQQRLKTSMIAFQNEKWEIQPILAGSKKLSLSSDYISKIDLYTPLGKLLPLASLNRSYEKRSKVFGLENQSKASSQSIYIQAPYKVIYDLPDGASRFVANVSLKDKKHYGAGWANSVLKIFADDKLLREYNISLKKNNIQMNVPLKGMLSLTIILDPGINGPIMDQIIMHQPMVLVK